MSLRQILFPFERIPARSLLTPQKYHENFHNRRVPVYWGQWQLVEATINLIREALANDRDYEYMVLLSGSCYPIRSKEYIQWLLTESHGDEFMNASQMPNAAGGKSMSRLDRFYIRSDQSKLECCRGVASAFLSRPKSGWVLTREGWLSRDWRRVFGSVVPYGGSTWWALTGDACRYIDDFVRRE